MTAPGKSGALARLGLVALAGLLAALLTWGLARAWPDRPVERATVASVAFIPLWLGLGLGLLAWRRAARPGAARRRLFALHRDLGGALAVIAILVFGSGIGAVADRALTRWQVVARHEPVPSLAEQPLDLVLADLLAREPSLVRGELAVHPASAEQPWIQLDYYDSAREPVRLTFDARSGAALDRGRPPLWVVRELHRRLLAPPLLGETVLGLLGLALALVLCAGLATRRDWLRNLWQRRRTHQPTGMRLHQWIGFFTLPAALVWACSGALLGLTLLVVPIVGGAAYDGDRSALMRDVLAADRPPLVDTPRAFPPLRDALAATCPLVQEHLPHAEVHRISIRHPGRASGTIRVDLEGFGLFERGSFTRATDGVLRDCRALPAAGPGLQAFMAAIVLHYGEWGPPWLVDLAYLVLGASLVGLAWLGGALLARRRERDGDPRSAERLRRWLVGVGLGLPLALTALLLLSRLPSRAHDESLALAVFLAVAGLALALALTGPAERRAGLLTWTLALALAAVPLAGWLAAGVAPGPVELALVTVAAALVGLRARAVGRAARL